MINYFSEFIARWLTNNYKDEMPSYQKTRYSIKLIITNLLPLLLIFGYGLYSDTLIKCLICLLSFSILRQFSGGFHLKNADICIVASTLLILSITEISVYVNDSLSIVFNIISFLLCLIFSPSKINNSTRIRKENFHIFKIISLILIIFSLILKNPTVTLAMFMQALTLIHIPAKEVIVNEE
ncbi:accessory gene regulator B [Paenibacillus sophorae]|uniref:Accessory gene regulator B n=1 Tax=Paenibacillus sophorae TaxID=1333845 RepID=A0A1H8GTK1_9BACL|nr:accessory gene regulator B family protein [Paenibacillus sophorae]SEN47372.1 accessory gene regulator B [Paenibacillus sophorae]